MTIDVYKRIYPHTLLSPDESRDRDGAVSPSITGSVDVVPGQYGDAWMVNDGGQVTHPNSTDYLAKGTILVRCQATALTGARSPVEIGDYGGGATSYLRFVGPSSSIGVLRNGKTVRSNIGSRSAGTWFTAAILWDGYETNAALDGIVLTGNPPDDIYNYWTGSNINIGFGRPSTPASWWGAPVESVLIYDDVLPDEEILRISTMPEAWTWENSFYRVPADNLPEVSGPSGRASSDIAPSIGFGIPGTQNFARFDILADNISGMYGAWTASPRIIETPIVGSMTTEVQITHVGLAKLTLQLRFKSREDYFKLQAMLLKRRTLVLYEGFVPHRGETYHWQGQDYEEFPATLLASLVPHFGIDDTEATATFWRAPDRMGVTL